MSYSITGLSPREAELLIWLAGSGQSIFRPADLREHWPEEPTLERSLSRLARGGWLKRIERGLYMLVPLEAGPERAWAQDSLIIGTRLARPSAIAYWSALRYWNLTEQLPRTVFVQTPQRKANTSLTVNGVSYRIIQINLARFFGVVTSSIAGQEFEVTDREKTLIDALDRPELSGGIWQVAQALMQTVDSLDWDRFEAYLERFASGAVFKRLGYLVENMRPAIPDVQERLTRWQARLTAGIANLDPGEQRHGPVTRRWRVRDNVGLSAGWQGEGK